MKKINLSKTVLCMTLCIAIFLSNGVSAQELNKSSQKGESSLGLGLGLNYGGIGARYSNNVADQVSVFGSLGYMLAGPGFNVGVQYTVKSSTQAEFYMSGMFGANAATKVEGLSEYDDVFYGPSFGLGVKLNSRKTEGNYWDFGLLLPVTSSSFKDQNDQIKGDPRVAEYREAWPVLLTVGFNFNL